MADASKDGSRKRATSRHPAAQVWSELCSFFREVPRALILAVALATVVFVAAQPATFLDKGWAHYEVLQRTVLWFLRGTIVRSLLGGLAVLTFCSFLYWSKIRRQRFIVVSDFRVWGELRNRYPPEGVAARLRDELMSLCNGARESDAGLQSSNNSDSVPNHESIKARQVLFIEGGLSLPETHVTLQYEGISLEGFLTFVRRTTKREVVLTGDLLLQAKGIKLVSRATDDGPWQVAIPDSDSPESLTLGLQRLALHIMAGLSERFQPKAANAFGLLHSRARDLEEYDLGLHLAKLAHEASPNSFEATSNLAVAHADIGVQLANRPEDPDYRAAASEFEEATSLNPSFYEAFEHLGRMREALGEMERAKEAFESAERIKKELKRKA